MTEEAWRVVGLVLLVALAAWRRFRRKPARARNREVSLEVWVLKLFRIRYRRREQGLLPSGGDDNDDTADGDQDGDEDEDTEDFR